MDIRSFFYTDGGDINPECMKHWNSVASIRTCAEKSKPAQEWIRTAGNLPVVPTAATAALYRMNPCNTVTFFALLQDSAIETAEATWLASFLARSGPEEVSSVSLKLLPLGEGVIFKTKEEDTRLIIKPSGTTFQRWTTQVKWKSFVMEEKLLGEWTWNSEGHFLYGERDLADPWSAELMQILPEVPAISNELEAELEAQYWDEKIYG